MGGTANRCIAPQERGLTVAGPICYETATCVRRRGRRCPGSSSVAGVHRPPSLRRAPRARTHSSSSSDISAWRT
eukprot:1699299-Alexandrium_andersonii.AAC.1